MNDASVGVPDGGRSLLASLVLIARYYARRYAAPLCLLGIGVLLGVLSQQAIVKYGELGVVPVVGLVALVIVGACIALLSPALCLGACAAVAFSNASTPLLYYYGLPVLSKYLPMVLLGAIVLHRIRQLPLDVLPSAFRIDPVPTVGRSAGFTRCLVLLALFFAFTLASTLHAADNELATLELAGQRTYLILGLAIALSVGQFGRWSTLPRLMLIALYGMSFSILLALIASFHPPLEGVVPGFMNVYNSTEPGGVADRVSGAFGHPNTLGRYAVLMMPIALALIWLCSGVHRVLSILCLLILFSGLVLSESRGALLVLAILLLPAALLIVQHVRARHWLPAVLVGAAVAVAAWQFVDADRMLQSVEDASRIVLDGDAPIDEATRGRLSEMRVAFELWKNHPVLGIGLGNYEHYFQTYSHALGTKLYNADRAAHSLYLEVLAERGIVGLVAYLVAIGGIVLTVLRHGLGRLRARATSEGILILSLVVAGISYYLSAMLLHDVHSAPHWALVGLMIGSIRQPLPARHSTQGNAIRTREEF